MTVTLIRGFKNAITSHRSILKIAKPKGGNYDWLN
jgi:hypothetical protein